MKHLSICTLSLFLNACASSQLPAPYENRSINYEPPPLTSGANSANSTITTNTNSKTPAKPASASPAYQNRYDSSSVATAYPLGQNETNRRDDSSYIVQPGDTIASIARQKGLTIRTLLNLNNLDDPSLISPGQKLLIKPAASQTSLPAVSSQANHRDESNKLISQPITLITSPKVNKEPYSEDLYKRLLRGESVNVKPISSEEIKKQESKQENKQGQTVEKTAISTAATPVSVNAPVEDAPAKASVSNPEKLSAVEQAKMQWPHTGAHSSANNRGLTIRGSKGSSIVAADDGTVTLAGSGLSGYGQMIIVKHANNLISLYGNVGKIIAKEGTRVTKGQKIGELNAETPLIFEVRDKGRSVSPLPLLRTKQ